MSVFLTEAFSSFHFKGDHFISLYEVAQDFCFHSGFHRITCGNLATVIGQEHILEFNLVTGFTLQVRNIQVLTFLYFKLLPCDFYNC